MVPFFAETGSRRRRRGLGTALLVLAALAAVGAGRVDAASAMADAAQSGASAPPTSGGDPEVWRAVRGILRSRGVDDRRETGELTAELAALGRPAIDELFEVCTGSGTSRVVGADEITRASDWWGGPESFSRLAEQALGRMTARHVVAHLRSRCTPDAELATRLAAVRVLGELGAAEGLELLFAIAADCGPLALRYRSVRGPVERAVGRILARDDRAWGAVPRLVRDLDGEPLAILLETIGRSHRPEAAEALASALGRDPKLDGQVLESLAIVADRAPWRLRTDPQPSVRARLDAEDWRLRRAAAVATARLHDTAAFGRLVKLRDDEHAAVRGAARWALVQMTGSTLPSTPEEWWDVHDAQLGWWVREGRGVVAAIASDDAGRALTALRAIGDRPLLRREAAPCLKSALRDDRPALILAACSVAVRIEAKEAVPGLVDALDRQDDDVRQAAWRALRTLTGADLPPDSDVWHTFVHLGHGLER